MAKTNVLLAGLAKVSLLALLSGLTLACASAVKIPPVHEPFDSVKWTECAKELQLQESGALIADLTLDSKTLLCEGAVLASKGKTKEALELLTEAGVRDKEDHRPHYLSGRVLVEVERYEEALSAFERSQDKFPSMETPSERLGRRVMKKHGDEKAIEFLRLAKDRKLCPYGCKCLLAKLYLKTGDKPKSERLYTILTKGRPDEPNAFVGLANIRNIEGDHAAESDLITQAVKSKNFKKLPKQKKAVIHYHHAFARYNAKKYAGAEKSIERALAMDKTKADWWVLAGWIQLKVNNAAMALVKFDKAASMESTLAAAQIGRGDAMAAMSQYTNAFTAYERARKLDPANAVILVKQAYAKAKLGDKDTAKSLLDEAIRRDNARLPKDLVQKVTNLL